MPDEVIEVSLCERFGWTFTELDEQDASRVLPAVSVTNMRESLKRVVEYTLTHGKVSPTKHDWEVYVDLTKEVKGNA